jgi:Cu(I)/Ag(I) efflux system membrane fusion protein
MKSVVKLIMVGVAIATALFASYWWGSTQSQRSSDVALSAATSTEKKILYYRNPMGLPDTSPVPKKDPMGMDYLPVYEGEESPSDQTIVKISTEKIQTLGVLTETATLRELTRTIRAVATIQADERKLYTLVTKFEGWIQRLYVNTTGQAVKKGDALMDVYSPDLITAQQEYLIALRGLQSTADSDSDVQASMQRLVTSALQKLRNWDIAETELQRLQQTGEVRQYMTLRSKADGVVLEKKAVMGQRFMPGEVLYQSADYPNKVFNGEIAFIYPTVTPETRTAIVRVVLPNPDGLLKPAMYARVEFASSHSKDKVLAIPDSAVLDTGTRRVVLVDLGAGRFEPRTVKLGMHADGYAEVLGGINAGETVVVKANFLIDAESNLKAVLSGFGHGGHQLPDEKKETGTGSFVKVSPSKTHRGEGTINAMDFAHATVTLAHGPIASLQWPAMTMDFRVSDPALLRSLKPGQKVAFEITEESAGEYIIVHIQPADLSLGTTAHGGH